MSTPPLNPSVSTVSGNRLEFVRGSPLRIARTALLIACLLNFIQAGVEFFTAEAQFEKALERELERLGGNVQLDQGRVRTARERYVRITRVKASVIAGLGAALLLLSRLVDRYLLFSTLGGLILFLGVTITMPFLTWNRDVATFFLNNWRSLAWELVITASLIMGVQAALQHQRERTKRVRELMEKLDVMPMD